MFKSKFKFSITNFDIIFFKDKEGKEIRRKVPLKNLSGLSKKMKKGSKSLLIHIRGGADEFFYTSSRDEIMDLLKRLFAYSKKTNLPVFAPAESKLIYYCTSQEEGEQGLTRMPDKKFALTEENILEGPKESESTDTVIKVLIF